MPIPLLLKQEDPADFTSRQAVVRRLEDRVEIEFVGSEMSFAEMKQLRHQSADPETVKREINGEGHLFANVGVSLALTTMIHNNAFAVSVYQERPDFGDAVLKLISGYVDARMPIHEAALKELSEEFLLTRDSNVVPGEVMPFQLSLKKPYDGMVAYAEWSDRFIAHVAGEKPGYLPSLDALPAMTHLGKALIMYFAPLHTAQVIFPLRVDLPNVNDLCLFHAEEKLEKGKLYTELNINGLVLLEMDGQNKLTGNTYRLVLGKLMKGPNKKHLKLSEAFVAPEEGLLVTRPNIPFEEYLQEQK